MIGKAFVRVGQVEELGNKMQVGRVSVQASVQVSVQVSGLGISSSAWSPSSHQVWCPCLPNRAESVSLGGAQAPSVVSCPSVVWWGFPKNSGPEDSEVVALGAQTFVPREWCGISVEVSTAICGEKLPPQDSMSLGRGAEACRQGEACLEATPRRNRVGWQAVVWSSAWISTWESISKLIATQALNQDLAFDVQ